MKKQEITAQQKIIIAKINFLRKYYQEIEEIESVENDKKSVDFRDFSEEEEINFQKEIKKIA